jgi:hypothetical protein
LANICVYLYRAGRWFPSYASCTLANGTYVVQHVARGSYDVEFIDMTGTYVTQWYTGKTGGSPAQSGAAAVTVPGGNQTLSGITAVMSLVPTGNVSGTVTNASGSPLANICVYLYRAGRSFPSYASCTLANGTYVVQRVASGSYDVEFIDMTGTYVTQWYTGKTGGSPAQSGAVAVTVPGGNQTLSGTNAAMSLRHPRFVRR